jgi:energy-coupling factor transport system permease protein
MSLATRLEVADPQLDSVLGRVSPVVKLGIALVWLIGLATTTAIVPPLALAAIALAAGVALGAVPVPVLARTLAPLAIAALGIGLSNTIFAAANLDPDATELVRIGPLRITVEGLLGGLAMAARVTAIASLGAVVTLTTDSTRLADSLVQQARLSPRFAYGALAAYQAIPRFSDDLATLRQARRIRGLRGAWHPRLLLGMLILAIRHGDRLALAMDARGFGHGPRSWYRTVRWSWLDAAAVVGAVAVLVAALAIPGVVAG